MIARFRLLVNEAVRSVWANLSTTVAATMTVLIGMVLLGLFIGLGTWVLSYSDHIKKELLVKVFFCAPSDEVRVCPKGARETPDSVNAVTAKLQGLQASGDVKRYTFVSKDEALRRFRKDSPDLAQPLTSNPFPDGFEVVPTRPENISPIRIGPTSRKVAKPVPQPSSPVAPKRRTKMPDWMTMMPPVKNAVSDTIGSDCHAIL